MQWKQSNQQNQESQNEEVNSTEFDLASLPKPELTGHAWIQKGTMIECQSCPFPHASAIPSDYQLYGIDERGYPQLRKIQLNQNQP